MNSLDESIFWDRFISGYYSNGQFQEVRIGYAGYVRDPLMGTLLARHRWYDPAAGRWITRDPAGYVDGLSLYLFVKGNPLGLVDPTGLSTKLGRWLHKKGWRRTGGAVDRMSDGVASIGSGEIYQGGYANNLVHGVKEAGNRITRNPWAQDAAWQMNKANVDGRNAMRALKNGETRQAESILAHSRSELANVQTANANTGQLASTGATLVAAGTPLSPILGPIGAGASAVFGRAMATTIGQRLAATGLGQAMQKAYSIGNKPLGQLFGGSGTGSSRGGLAPVQAGQAGESVSSRFTGLPANTARIPSASGNRAYRVPDHMEQVSQRYIAETKNVNYQPLSSQLLDDASHVTRGGYAGRVDVIVDVRTEVSTPLLRQHLNVGSPIKLTTLPLD